MEVVTLDNNSKNWQIYLVWSIKFLRPNDSVPPEKQVNKGIASQKKLSCCLTLRQERHRFMKKLKIYSLSPYEEMNLNSNNDETDDID